MMRLKFTLLGAIAMFAVSGLFAQTQEVQGTMAAYSGYVPGSTVEIPVALDLTNMDDEWGDSLSITFPAGMTVTAVSNDDFFAVFNNPNFDDEAFNGIDGQTISWGDNDNDWGGIPAGEGTPWEFTITVQADAGVSGDQTIEFFVSGDGFGPNPADFSGTFVLSEGLSIAGIIVNSDDHTTLEAALNAAGLLTAVGTIDPLTIFAPNDAAFDALEAAAPGTLAFLLDPANVGVLSNILLYHVTPAAALSTDLTDGMMIPTLEENGFELTATTTGGIFINGEEVIVPFDVAATNGVLHNISGVLVPPVVVTLPIDFELPAEAYETVAFGDVVGDIIANPDPTGVNTSDNVFRQIQPNTPTNFGGAFVLMNVAADFSESPLVAVDVWTPEAGVPVTLRFENGPNTVGIEETLPSVSSGAWETIVFDFSADLAGVADDVELVRAVVFFDLGAGNNDATYYMDNIRNQDLPSIFEIVEGSDIHNELQGALEFTGLDGALDNPDADFTLFAPTDQAFADIQAIVDDLLLDATGNALGNVLLHHLLAGTVLSGAITDGLSVPTVQGEAITFNIVGENVTVSDASGTAVANLVLAAVDIPASNGVVHVIDAVLVPNACTVVGATYLFGDAPVAVDGICPIEVFGAFQAWAGEAYAVENCVNGTTYTFGLTGGALANGLWTPTFVVTDVTSGAVIEFGTGSVPNSITFTAVNDGTIIVSIQEEGFCGAESPNSGTGSDNGFAYVTCESSLTITDIVVANDDFSTLETAVVAAGLDGVLAGEGPFTVFAPTNDAFAALDPDLLASILANVDGLLIPTLQHHVVPAIAYSTDLSDGQVITTLNEDVTVGIDGTTVTITSSLGVVAEVTAFDIIASNGVIHVIDAVLAPTVVNTDQLTSVDKLNVYPNPTNDQFTVDIDLNNAERVTIDIINILGQVVKTQDLGMRSSGLNREYINVDDLNSGMYFMSITVGENQGTVKVHVSK